MYVFYFSTDEDAELFFQEKIFSVHKFAKLCTFYGSSGHKPYFESMLVYLLHKYVNIFKLDISNGKVSNEQMYTVFLTKSLINKIWYIVHSNVHVVCPNNYNLIIIFFFKMMNDINIINIIIYHSYYSYPLCYLADSKV